MHVERRCASFLSVGVLCVPATSSCQNSHALANAVCMITIQFLTITMTKNVKTFSIIVFLSDHRLYMCALAYMTSVALCHQPNIARTKLCTALSLHAELAWNDTEQVLDSFSRYYFFDLLCSRGNMIFEYTGVRCTCTSHWCVVRS